MKIICIGAGAAGLFFSLNAALKGHEVILLESNSKAGRKLAITGKGRCNITNNCSINDFINNVVNNPKFLYSSLNSFSPKDTIDWFNNHGCPLKTERGNRVFPISDKSSDIIDTLLKECENNNVKIIYDSRVEKASKVGDTFKVITKGVTYLADRLVIASGGMSYPYTGSRGDGYRFAESFGHRVITPKSALCPIKIREKVTYDMLDFTLKNVALTATGNKFNKTIFGDMEFLFNSITGPISLSMSSLINKLDDVSLSLDFKPALSEEKLEKRILRDISNNPNKNVEFLLRGLLPSEIIDFFVSNTHIALNKALNSFTKGERAKLVSNLKHFKLTFNGLDSIDKGIVTSGGVSVKQIDQKSMESKLVEGLYFIGEVLDVDALTGGFNLQIALSTAFAASIHI